ncbi:RHS repeat-associated core domain-containing protein, partial [Sinomicrobium oceani]
FNFQINYNKSRSGVVDPLYNGNIAETYWKTSNDNTMRRYAYTYDALNRITSGKFNGGGQTDRYTVEGITYDKNGNIEHLTRRGHVNSGATSFGVMDNLAYTYDTGNKLLKVTDSGNKTYGFKDGTNTGNDYTYDANGNLLTDANKGITGISYNHLNLPTQVSFGSNKIAYIYDASGTKLKKEVTQGSSVTATEYAGNYIYENGQLQFFNTPEGYVTKENNTYTYVYQYKDHLGNVRLSYTNTGTASAPQLEIIEENNYYPFGLEHRGYNNQINGPENNYQTYQGKEHQKELSLNWHDFGARNYNAAIGRWMSPDPLSEEFPEWSPYVFTYNNPIKWTDPTGMAPEDIVIRMLNEQGKSVEAFRIHTDLIETEVNLESNGLTYTGTETTNVYFDDKLTDYTEKLGGSEYLPDALSINASAEAAYKGGAQLEVSVLGILKGENKGDFGVTLQMNGLMGVEGGITGTLTGFYATQPNPDLDVFKGAEMGLQADVKAFGPASIAGAYHRGVEFQKPFDKNWNWRGFTKTTYEAISLGVSGGVVPLPVSFSGYLGVSDYIYRSDK